MASVLSAADLERLLDGLDGAFQATLHSRFGGGAEAYVMSGGALGVPQILRTTRAGSGACVRMQLYPENIAPGPASAPGTPVGTIRLSADANPQIDDLTIVTEILEDRDPNEHADATVLNSGVTMCLITEGLLVVRSREGSTALDSQSLQRQRAWRPDSSRHGASGMPGLAGRSQRVSSPPSLMLPVAADLLHRIGTAIGKLDEKFRFAALIIDTNV